MTIDYTNSSMGEIACLNHGYVALTDVMGNDRTAAHCARTSYRNKDASRTKEQDDKLTKFLVKHGHTTPIEFCQARFYMKMPIFVSRQLVRHRTASINEMSLRYVKAANEYYIPELDRCQKQSETNKQGSSVELVDDPAGVRHLIAVACDSAYSVYEELIREGLSMELARTVLPLGTYTEWYWQCDLHNILHLLDKRTPSPDGNPQYETMVYAQAMLDLLTPHFPVIIEAWLEKTGRA